MATKSVPEYDGYAWQISNLQTLFKSALEEHYELLRLRDEFTELQKQYSALLDSDVKHGFNMVGAIIKAEIGRVNQDLETKEG